MKDFWLSCGHHLLDRDEHGELRVTDEFMKALSGAAGACAAARGLRRRTHAACRAAVRSMAAVARRRSTPSRKPTRARIGDS